MTATRREVLALGGGVAVAATIIPFAQAIAVDPVAAEIERLTGGTIPAEGGVVLDIPEIAENGGAVPVTVSAPGARRIAVVSEGNPNPQVVNLRFGRYAEPVVSTRVRLAGTQNLIALAEMADGSFRSASRFVIVTAGGCG